jgi:hypothetical protein
MLTRCLALAIAIASGTTAYGGTVQDAYEKLWNKRAIDVTDPNAFSKPKAACVCLDGSALNGRLGVFATDGPYGLCALPTFDGAGNVVAAGGCNTFEYIGK